MRKRILSISYDESLLNTRQWILEQAGYDVTSALGFLDAQAECNKGGFDLIIIGHSVPRTDEAALALLSKKDCAGAILSLRKPGQPPLAEADYSTYRSDPEGLLEAVRQAVGAAND